MKMKVLKSVGLALLALTFIPVAWAQGGQTSGQGQQQNPPKPPDQSAKPGQPEAAPATPATNPEEEKAYKDFYGLPNTEMPQVIQAGEDFVKKFPESRYNGSVYARLTTAYLNTGQEDKMFAAGEKTLELNPNNVDVLALLAMVMPRRVNPGSLDADQKLQKSQNYAKQAITLLTALQKPEALTEEQFTKAKNEKLSMCHSGLGLVDFHRQKFTDAAGELQQAVQLAPTPDPVDYYVLGLSYENAKHYSEAATAFEHCSTNPWQLQARCKQAMDQAKKLASSEPQPPKP